MKSGHSVLALTALLPMAGPLAAAAYNRVVRYRLEGTDWRREHRK